MEDEISGEPKDRKAHQFSSKQNKSSRKKAMTEEAWMGEYKRFFVQEGKSPDSVFEFTRFVNRDEGQFYDTFSGLKPLEQKIWARFFEETVNRLKSEGIYSEYSVREKILAFYFTLIEVLKEDRSYIIKAMKEGLLPRWSPYFLETFKAQYINFVKGLIEEGKETGEVADRMFITNRYGEALWLQCLFILKFWLRDESDNFEKTDAAIEKAVNLSLDLMGRTALDSFADFAKFLYQSSKST